MRWTLQLIIVRFLYLSDVIIVQLAHMQCCQCVWVAPGFLDLISSAKKDLNTQQPDQLLCRDKEIDDITKFLISCVEDRKAGSLYISGAPGTGKTAVIKHLLAQHHKVALRS